MALIDKLTAIGNAIRSKTGATAKLSLDDMVTAIEGIKTEAETFIFTLINGLTVEKETILGELDAIGITELSITEGEVKSVIKADDGEVMWSAPLAIPTVTSSLTYTGSSQAPTVTGYDSDTMVRGGDASAINAGTYTVTYTPKDGYRWVDGTTETKSYTWSIAKAAGSLSINPTSIILNSDTKSKTITVTKVGDGAISAVSNDTSVATVSVSGNVVTVNSVNDKTGTATITVSVAEGTNWRAATDVTCSVSAEFTTLITFTIEHNGTVETLTAEEGMTWSEWMDSSYNTMGFYSKWTQVAHGQGADIVFVRDSNDGSVWDSSLIEDGAAYHTIA